MSALFLTTDLLFSSKVSGTASAMQLPVELVMSAAKLTERAAAKPDVRLILLDLANPPCNPIELVPQLRQAAPQASIVAFGPHVQDEKLMAAQEAGCNEVLTRGQFNIECSAILRRYLNAP